MIKLVSSAPTKLLIRELGKSQRKSFSKPTTFQPIVPIDRTNQITAVHPSTKNIADMYAKQEYRKLLSQQKYRPVRPRNGEPLVISCKRKRFNHYEGHKYPTLNDSYLASYGWKNSRYQGDRFVIRSKTQNPQDSRISFKDFDLNASIIDKLENQGIRFPTSVQISSLKVYSQTPNHFLCSAQTGSGKTFAYLVPLLSGKSRGTSIIVLPTNVLCDQVSNLIGFFDDASVLNLAKLNPNEVLKEISLSNKNIVVTTPHRLLVNEEIIHDSELAIRNIVLDEADTLFDPSFAAETIDLIKRFAIGLSDDEPYTRILAFTATLSSQLQNELERLIPNLQVLKDQQTNRVLSNVTQKFVRLKKSSKPEFVLSVLKPSSYNRKSPLLPAIVFCNRANTCHWLFNLLRQSGLSNVETIIASGQAKEILDNLSDRTIVITTDVMSRGIDTQWAKHVINYDFPTVLSNYVHRCGRVGRLGQNFGECLVTNLIANASEINCVQRIEMAVRTDNEMKDIDFRYEKK